MGASDKLTLLTKPPTPPPPPLLHTCLNVVKRHGSVTVDPHGNVLTPLWAAEMKRLPDWPQPVCPQPCRRRGSECGRKGMGRWRARPEPTATCPWSRSWRRSWPWSPRSRPTSTHRSVPCCFVEYWCLWSSLASRFCLLWKESGDGGGGARRQGLGGGGGVQIWREMAWRICLL